MQLSPGQFVKLIFRDGTQLEGSIISWSDEESLLQSLKNNSKMLIMQTKADVKLCEIIDSILKPKLIKDLPELEQEFEQVKQQPSTDLRLKNLAQLKIAMIEQEKQNIANKLRGHTITSIRNTQYSNPFIKSQ